MSLILDFKDPGAVNPFNVKTISGLDAGDLVSKYYAKSLTGPEAFYNIQLPSRQIVVRAGLNPNFSSSSYSDLRDAVYKLIGASKTGQVKLLLKNGSTVVAVVSGFTSKIETNLFEKDQEIQITINCEDPLLRSAAPYSVPFGTIGFSDFVIEDLESTAPHGFSFELEFTNTATDLAIIDPTDDSWAWAVIPIGGFFAGDLLYFSSELNNRAVYVVRGSTVMPLMHRVNIGSVWPLIFPGQNHFSFSRPGAIDWRSLSYYKTYWGV